MKAATALEDIFRREYGLVLSSLIKSFDDFDLAEEALSEAMATALETWPSRGIPERPAAWLLTVARRKGIDRLRRQRQLAEKLTLLEADIRYAVDADQPSIPDDRLQLIFACCHVALAPEARVALTLKALGGLTTAEIARAFLTSESTMFQRITRAKNKIRKAAIPIAMPAAVDLGERTSSVLAVVYLIFNEGYSSMTGTELIRVDLCREAIRLAEMMTLLLPRQPEVFGLASLCWLTESRRPARLDDTGELVLLADQDRSRWNRSSIERGLNLLERARELGGSGPYVVQAEIGALHATALNHEMTDWQGVINLYQRLLLLQPSPVVALNHAAAVAMDDGPEAGLRLMEGLAGPLSAYQPFHASRAELLARAGRRTEAAFAFEKALSFPVNEVERRHLTRRLAQISA